MYNVIFWFCWVYNIDTRRIIFESIFLCNIARLPDPVPQPTDNRRSPAHLLHRPNILQGQLPQHHHNADRDTGLWGILLLRLRAHAEPPGPQRQPHRPVHVRHQVLPEPGRAGPERELPHVPREGGVHRGRGEAQEHRRVEERAGRDRLEDLRPAGQAGRTQPEQQLHQLIGTDCALHAEWQLQTFGLVVEPSASHWHCSDRFVIQDPYN